ncbi:hypothetical protein Q8A67_010186 [Cirrhinus molitorella]|uniref:Ig-like domain-containing protein n=1 Tax=Cirrhinus molitorella TaxID=172907 RepID=A0AA88PT70_9TELE|nr:hypothetical protein Q8A67_010186 [Cirrhinus molitorella]
MLDDLQVMYYDSITRQAVHRSYNDSTHYDEEKSDAGVIFRDMYNDMKTRAFYLKEHLNHTDGIHVQQRLAGCELLDNGKPGLFYFWDAFSGLNMEEFTFDMEKNNIQMKMPWMVTWDQVKRLKVQFMYENVYHPICIKVLQRYLNMEKNSVMRKVKPRVRLMRKMLPDSQELQISCLATGFYPRHINLTLFRDGHPVDDDQITGGEILPNGDGTYQMRKSLVISEEDLRKGHKYNCTMKHLNLDNKLDIAFVKPRVRLTRKMLPDSQGFQIGCLATGFYPRHINLTLFKDGHPVDDDQITGGEILPNGDGTYQMRKSLVISGEELSEGHKYNCTMKHLNLDNKLDITFDVAEYEPGSFNLSVVVSVLVIMCVAVLIITYFIIWMKKRAAGQGSETSVSDYSLTPSSLQDET